MTDNTNTIYRFKFSDEFIPYLERFTDIYKYSKQKEYKEAWIKWCEEYKECVDKEESRLKEIGYDGDVKDKMYKSSRYYIRKKKPLDDENNKKERNNTYYKISEEVVLVMNRYIDECKKKPSDIWEEFYEENMDIINKEIETLKSKHTITDKVIISKLKKSLKNKYFVKNNKNLTKN